MLAQSTHELDGKKVRVVVRIPLKWYMPIVFNFCFQTQLFLISFGFSRFFYIQFGNARLSISARILPWNAPTKYLTISACDVRFRLFAFASLSRTFVSRYIHFRDLCRADVERLGIFFMLSSSLVCLVMGRYQIVVTVNVFVIVVAVLVGYLRVRRVNTVSFRGICVSTNVRGQWSEWCCNRLVLRSIKRHSKCVLLCVFVVGTGSGKRLNC